MARRTSLLTIEIPKSYIWQFWYCWSDLAPLGAAGQDRNTDIATNTCWAKIMLHDRWTVVCHKVILLYMLRYHSPALCGCEHGQTVGKLSFTSWRKEGPRMSEICWRRKACLIITLWMIHGAPLKDQGPKITWVTFLRFSLFQNPAAMSLKVDEYLRLLSNMWKVNFL